MRTHSYSLRRSFIDSFVHIKWQIIYCLGPNNIVAKSLRLTGCFVTKEWKGKATWPCCKITARRPVKYMHLTRAHERLRNEYAQHAIRRQQCHWRYTFADVLCVNFTDGRKCVWRRVGERFHPATIQRHDRYGGCNIMVKAGSTYRPNDEINDRIG